MEKLARLTPHQYGTLRRLARLAMLMATERPGRFVHNKDCGGPAALEHLYRKGYVERDLRAGPRGGEHAYYRPTAEGYAAVAKEADAELNATAKREMTLGEIDAVLIRARTHREIVRVFAGTFEYRGVPGPVKRGDDGVLVLHIGQRTVPVRQITKVKA